MKRLLILLMVIFTSSAFAQTDSVVIETYDLVYLKDGGIIKGQILSFDPSDGDLTFITEKGVKYFLTSKDYTAFKEDIPSKKKKKSQEAGFELRERKENQYELSVGFTSPAYFITAEKSVESDTHLPFDRSFIPLCVSAGFGKYIHRKHFVGVGIDFDIQSSLKSFYSVNMRYAHQYDAYSKNTSLYLPIELTYNHFRNRMPFSLDETDTTFFSDGTVSGSSYPKNIEYDMSFNTFGLSIGQGFGFILSNKNSISIEVALFKYFALNSKYYNLSVPEPSLQYAVQGFKFALRYNF